MSSLFGALDTAVSGLTAQSSAFGNISDNIANSQTIGFKGINTTFADYLSTSNTVTNDSGSVIAKPDYQNEVQGTITASDNPLALAISGSGFFQVSQEVGSGVTTTTNTTAEYSREGDFKLDSSGYLVNGTSQVLNGWLADPVTGVLDKSTIKPITVDQSPEKPAATKNVTIAANLPATPTAGVPVTSQVNVYDAKGTLHSVNLTFTQNADSNWTVAIAAPDAATPALGTATLNFGATQSGNAVDPGTIGSITGTTGTANGSAYAAGSAATLGFTADFGDGPQAINLQLGTFGGTNGLTQFAGTAYAPTNITQDGTAPGKYTGVSTLSNGNVVVSYDNGQTKVVAKVPVVQFENADKLQRQDGQAFTATYDSGAGIAQDVTTSGQTQFVSGSVENSNVDIATEFTKLIVAQQAYAANSKVITTANDMLTQTIDMKR